MNEPESPIMAKILIRFNFETEIYVRYRSEEIAPYNRFIIYTKCNGQPSYNPDIKMKWNTKNSRNMNYLMNGKCARENEHNCINPTCIRCRARNLWVLLSMWSSVGWRSGKRKHGFAAFSSLSSPSTAWLGQCLPAHHTTQVTGNTQANISAIFQSILYCCR